MSDGRTRPGALINRRETQALPQRRMWIMWLARRFVVALLAILSLAGFGHAQSQSDSSQTSLPQPQVQPSPVPRQTNAATVADAARNAKSQADESAPTKVYTNKDVAALPPGGVSIVGSAPPAPGAAKSEAQPADDNANLAAYWKARFTAARRKLAQDKRALPALQAQLNIERVQEYPSEDGMGNLHSDRYMDLLYQIDATKAAIQNDRQALNDLHDEFRHAGGQPGWIR